MTINDQLPDVVMPHCPHRNLLKGQKALVTGASSNVAAWCQKFPTPLAKSSVYFREEYGMSE